MANNTGSGNGDKLLPGESTSISSGNSSDAAHWIDVYAELVGFKETLLERLTEQRRKVKDEGQAELDADESLLRPEAARLRRRLDFWRHELGRRAH